MEFVLFDIGGVLCDVEPKRAEAVWSSLQHGNESIMTLMDSSGAKPRGDVGALDAQGMASCLSDYIGTNVSEQELRTVWGAMVQWRPFVKELTAALNVPYGVLSTIDPIHSDSLGDLEGASPIVYSWKIGVAKPHKEAFMKAIAACPCEPKEILYLDDLEENVAEANRCGMVAVQVKDEREIRRALGTMLR